MGLEFQFLGASRGFGLFSGSGAVVLHMGVWGLGVWGFGVRVRGLRVLGWGVWGFQGWVSGFFLP